jgi:hypothetical protein
MFIYKHRGEPNDALCCKVVKILYLIHQMKERRKKKIQIQYWREGGESESPPKMNVNMLS